MTKPYFDYILKSNGSIEEVVPSNGRAYTLDELQKIVGGYIEMVTPNKGSKIMIVNEEGKLYRMPLNVKATNWIRRRGVLDFVVGDALIIEEERLV